MKKLLAALAFIGCTTTALADAKAFAVITSVKTNWENVSVNVPKTKCRDVEVPIYQWEQTHSNGASGGDVLTGMIIGGLLGKGVTGKDNGAAAGAVFGGIIAADKKHNTMESRRVIIGYNIERSCTKIQQWETQERVKNYRITYVWNDTYGQSYTANHYKVGDRIPITVSLQAD